jgi:GT2 family glycosyltransferase
MGDESDGSRLRDLERDPSLAFAQSQPRLSVVVPAHDSGVDLARCLDALIASDLPRNEWELIVVDDSSDDSTPEIARSKADRVIRLEGGARGPAFARNRGAESAGAPIVAFVDADVMVHPDALRLTLGHFDEAHITAVFGSYDDAPSAPGFVSQYRNLLHHYVHQHSARAVESFWAGCGAIRKEIFTGIGMFDEKRYRRPEMEDVELGYRLRDQRHDILLDPRILCTHCKHWTLGGMVRSDFARRGVPWTRLLVERKMLLSPRGLSLGVSQRAGAITATMFAALTLAALIWGGMPLVLLAAGALAAFAIASRDFLGWLAGTRGLSFTLAAIPLHLLYNLVAVSAVAWGSTESLFRGPSARASYTRRQ